MSANKRTGAVIAELREVIERVDDTLLDEDLQSATATVNRLKDAALRVGEAWSGSYIGYQSRVYYRDFQPVPPGARFSQEWGLTEKSFSPETIGDWVEYRAERVESEIYSLAGDPDMSEARRTAERLDDVFDAAQHDVVSLLSVWLQNHSDSLVTSLLQKIEDLKIPTASDLARASMNRSQFISRDTVALQQGILVPPHIEVAAYAASLNAPGRYCRDLVKLARRAAAHMARLEANVGDTRQVGTKIFIGHGRSAVWRDLRDFIRDRLQLPWEEFNRVPVAGLTTVARLSQMLDDALFAFLVLTGEDEDQSGILHARMNVVHEAGLFQGRLGFERAIILLEDGCEEFSNIQGLGQIRFPKGNINAVSEEVRLVLEREGLLGS